jgi:hypothetical protein
VRIWLSGGEVPKHRDLLGKVGAERIAINLSSVVKERSGGLGDPDTLLPFSKLFYTSQSDLDEGAYDEVLERYLDDDSLVLGIDSWVAKKRNVFIPEWHGGDIDELLELAVEYGRIGISEGVLATESLMKPLGIFRVRNPHVALFTTSSKPKLIAPMVASDVLVSGWLSAQKHRELQVWDGAKVARFPRAARVAQVQAHKGQITNLGSDFGLIEEGDVPESMKLAVTSWLQYEKVAATQHPAGSAEPGIGGSLDLATDGRSSRKREELVMLPILRTPTEDLPDAAPVASSLRQCNSCSLSGICPKFEKDSMCGFAIPVTLRTKSDVQAMMSTLLEVQAQRALMSKFEEDLLSQGATPETSSEIERFFRLTETSKRISEERFNININATGPAGPGPLSALFGDKVGELNQGLRNPVGSDDIIDDSDIIDQD